METGMKSAREDAREDRREQGRKGSARGRGGGQGKDKGGTDAVQENTTGKIAERSLARSTRRKSKAGSFRLGAVLHGGTAFFAFIRHWQLS